MSVEHVPGQTWHRRQGALRHDFRHGVDYILIDPEAPVRGLRLFSRNRANLLSLRDGDHGGAPGQGRGAAWLRDVLAQQGLEAPHRLLLLTQPRVLGHVFNPVSFWLCHDAAGALRVVVAEVSNTFGERHAYLCHRDDLGPIGRRDRIMARKVFHVSPFQPLAGDYAFRFDIRPDRLSILIDYRAGAEGVLAMLAGPRRPLTDAAILRAFIRRPFGSRRVLALIYWQALILRLRGAVWRSRPAPPDTGVSR